MPLDLVVCINLCFFREIIISCLFVCLCSAYVLNILGKYGVQNDRKDKSAMGWDHVEKVDKHESQKDYKTGFGGNLFFSCEISYLFT